MLNKPIAFSLVAAAVAAACTGSAYAAEPLEPYAHKGKVIQRLTAFDNPEAAIFSADGNYVFISNAAELGMPDKGFHFVRGAGYISKLAVQPDGTLQMVDEKLLSGLTAPLGMAVSTVATQKFPKGTIFVGEAWAPLAEADGSAVSDPQSIDPKIIAFSPEGQILGAIKMGEGSAAHKASGVVATLNNALAFDKAGNLYSIDTGIGGGTFKPAIATNGGGAYMFPVESLDALADGREAAVYYIATPNSGPDGIEVGPDGIIHFNTVGVVAGLKDPAEGGMYRARIEDFKSGNLPKPFVQGLGALDGLTFAGTARLDTEIKNTGSVVVTPFWSGEPYQLTYDQDIKFAGPADIATYKMDDGSYLLVVPELAPTSPNNKDNPVTVIRLPADFDRFTSAQQ